MSDSVKFGQLKARIDRLKTEILMEEGNLSALKRELKEDFQCDTVEEARNKADKMYSRADTMNGKLIKGIQEVKDEYGI